MRNVLSVSVLAMIGVLAACSGDESGDSAANGAASQAQSPTQAEAQASGGESSSSGAAASGSSSSGGSSGSALPAECTADADCNHLGEPNACSCPKCTAGKCIRELLQPGGTKIASQRYGDCSSTVCGPNGELLEVPDDADRFVINDYCVVSTCNVGKGSITMRPLGEKCGASTVCDGKGACVACNVDADCAWKGAGYACIEHMCAGTSCKNGMKDPGEGDVDCGGACPKCWAGKTCISGTQCSSGVCTAGTCAEPSCSDGKVNGNESGVDCGGGVCPKCATDSPCKLPWDCASGVCQDGFCAAPSCTDAVKNGDETGTDCGGSCPACLTK